MITFHFLDQFLTKPMQSSSSDNDNQMTIMSQQRKLSSKHSNITFIKFDVHLEEL